MMSFIVAMDKNNVIGYKNEMPWHLPRDLKFFKEKTTGHTIVMGRKTFESIGRVLPNRKHVIITRDGSNLPEEVEVINNINEVIDLAKGTEEEIFVLGGGNIFEQLLPYADKLYVTLIDETFEGDVYFPDIPEEEFVQISKEKGIKDEKNPYDYYFIEYERKE